MSEVAKPPLDPAEILSKLEALTKRHRNAGGSSWVGTLILIAVAVAASAVWAWISSRRNRELAKLRHKREVQRIKAERAKVDADVEKNDAAVAEARKAERAIEERLRHLEADIRTEDERYAADLRAVDRIRSWADAGVR